MASTKYILEKIKIEGVIHDLLVKADAPNTAVTWKGSPTTLEAALADIATTVAALPTGDNVDTKISAAISGLIGGAPETYDTLKEVADYIESHEDVVTALNAAIGNKVDKVEGKGLSTEDFTTALKTALEGLAGLGLTAEKVAAWDAKAENTVATTEAHGLMSKADKAKLDGITPEKIASWDGKAEATAATSTADGLMSKEDKARLDGLGTVRYGTEVPADMKNGDLFIRVVSEA